MHLNENFNEVDELGSWNIAHHLDVIGNVGWHYFKYFQLEIFTYENLI